MLGCHQSSQRAQLLQSLTADSEVATTEGAVTLAAMLSLLAVIAEARTEAAKVAGPYIVAASESAVR